MRTLTFYLSIFSLISTFGATAGASGRVLDVTVEVDVGGCINSGDFPLQAKSSKGWVLVVKDRFGHPVSTQSDLAPGNVTPTDPVGGYVGPKLTAAVRLTDTDRLEIDFRRDYTAYFQKRSDHYGFGVFNVSQIADGHVVGKAQYSNTRDCLRIVTKSIVR